MGRMLCVLLRESCFSTPPQTSPSLFSLNFSLCANSRCECTIPPSYIWLINELIQLFGHRCVMYRCILSPVRAVLYFLLLGKSMLVSVENQSKKGQKKY